MIAKRLIDRLTPVTAGMALALLAVALVVQPVRADSSLCTQCRTYWYYWLNSGLNTTVCQGFPNPSYQRNNCFDNYVSLKCGDKPDDDSFPCPGPDSQGGLSDCTDPGCNLYPPDVGNICTWECWNKSCDSGDAEKRCYDAKVKCDPSSGDPSTKCSECKCVYSGSANW